MAAAIKPPRDPNTLSNYHNWMIKHTITNLDIDFEQRILSGNVILQLEAHREEERPPIVLDTSWLGIGSIKVNGHDANYELISRFEPYGSALKIPIDSNLHKAEVELDIEVKTTEKCTALQWLTPEQTLGAHPYLFSQSQAIHARSIFPCQDTPDVKSTFDFNIRSYLPVIASGLFTGSRDFQPGKDGTPGTLLYTFKQEVPIPSYLFAIASGDIASAVVGPRSCIASDPDKLQACKWEVEADMERFIQAAENIAGPYVWTTYNMLVLPPSFPYGGMENPVFTFATPTFITRDRENVDMIAHELAHSWSGNLVTNASWEHFWLNEGWTMYLQRRIEAAIHGEPARDFSAILGWKALSDSINEFGEDHEFTKLIPDLKGKDPDDAFSSVPYEKGFTFLYYLEKAIGKEKWDKFIPHYFTTFAQRSLDSYEFKSSVLSFFSSDSAASSFLSSLDWEKWFYAPGFPPKPDFDTSLADACYALAEKWESLVSSSNGDDKDEEQKFQPRESDISKLSSTQIVVFLERVSEFSPPLTKHHVELMRSAYKFPKSGNAEILSRFWGIGLKAGDEGYCAVATSEFLAKVGRMKFVRPLYRQLSKVDRDGAVQTFEQNKDFYHPICRAMVQKDLFGK